MTATRGKAESLFSVTWQAERTLIATNFATTNPRLWLLQFGMSGATSAATSALLDGQDDCKT